MPVFGLRKTPIPEGASPIATRYNSTWIKKGATPELAVPPVLKPKPHAAATAGNSSSRWGWIQPAKLDASDEEIFDWCEQTMVEDRLSFPFRVGDIQFASNHTCTHGRDGHTEVAEETSKRLLLRVWLDLPDSPPGIDDSVQRYGVIRHGNLGFTAAELRSGMHQFQRDPDHPVRSADGRAPSGGCDADGLAGAMQVWARRDDGASLRPCTT